MKNKKILLSFLVAGTLAAPLALFSAPNDAPAKKAPQSAVSTPKTSTPAGWTEDFDAAKKQAEREGKDLFVLFTGSDWCGWCIRLEKEVFSQKGFLEKLSEKFVPVFIDNPNNNALLSEFAQKQNGPLTKRYKVSGFPTVFLMDADGDVFARTGYVAGGPENYLKKLEQISSEGKFSPTHSAQKALKKLTEDDPDRAKKLDEILSPLPIPVQITHAAYIKEILAADPDGALGFRSKYPYFTTVIPIGEKLKTEILAISRRARSEIAKTGTVPQSREQMEALIRKVVAENPATLKALRAEIEKAKESFPKESFGRQELDNYAESLDEMLNPPKEKK